MEPIYIDVPVVIRVNVQKLVRLAEEAQTGANTLTETIYASPQASIVLNKPEKEDFDMGEETETDQTPYEAMPKTPWPKKRHYTKRKKSGVKKGKRAYHKKDVGPHPLLQVKKTHVEYALEHAREEGLSFVRSYNELYHTNPSKDQQDQADLAKGRKVYNNSAVNNKVAKAVAEAKESGRSFSSVFKEQNGYNPGGKYNKMAVKCSPGRKGSGEIMSCSCGKRFKQKHWYEKHIEDCPGYNKFQSASNPAYAEKLKKDNAYVESTFNESPKITFPCGICTQNQVDKEGEICDNCRKLIDEKNRADVLNALLLPSKHGVQKGSKRGPYKKKKKHNLIK